MTLNRIWTLILLQSCDLWSASSAFTLVGRPGRLKSLHMSPLLRGKQYYKYGEEVSDVCLFNYKKFESSCSQRKWMVHIEAQSEQQFSIWITDMIKSKIILSCSAVTVWRMFWRWIPSSKIIVAMIFLSSSWCKAAYTKLLPATKLMTVFYYNNQRRQEWLRVLNLDKRCLLTTITHQFSNYCFPQ